MKGKKAIGMKVLVVGLLFVGSLFIVTSIQAQEDLEEMYLEALDKAQEAVDRAENEKQRQKAESDVNELKAVIRDLNELQQQSISPGTVWVISVECNGECSDNTLGELCSRLIGTNFIPFAVDCQNVDNDVPPDVNVQCGGAGDNRCLARTVRSSDPLDWYCDDISGWDAQVYCIQQ
jgi:hypothetical protein